MSIFEYLFFLKGIVWVNFTSEMVLTEGVVQEKFFAIGALEFVGKGIEVEATGDRKSGDELGASDESMGGWIGIVTSSKVSVVRGDDGIFVSLLNVLSVPLANAWTAGVGKNDATKLTERLSLDVTIFKHI